MKILVVHTTRYISNQKVRYWPAIPARIKQMLAIIGRKREILNISFYPSFIKPGSFTYPLEKPRNKKTTKIRQY